MSALAGICTLTVSLLSFGRALVRVLTLLLLLSFVCVGACSVSGSPVLALSRLASRLATLGVTIALRARAKAL